MASTYLLGQINAARTLVENFPMSLLDYFKGRQYDNIIDFILDVLAAIPVNTDDVIGKIVQKVFKTDTPDINVIYKRLAYTDMSEPEWIVQVETVVQAAIAESLVAILTCSAIPEIPDRYMDALKYVRSGATGKRTLNLVDSYVDFSLEKILDEEEIEEVSSNVFKTYKKVKEVDFKVLKEDAIFKQYTDNSQYKNKDKSEYSGKVKNGNKNVVIKIEKAEDDWEYYYVNFQFHDKYDKKTEAKNDLVYNKTSPAVYGFLSLPVKSFDFFNKLQTSPATPYGSCLYDFGDNKFTYTAKKKYGKYMYTIPKNFVSHENFENGIKVLFKRDIAELKDISGQQIDSKTLPNGSWGQVFDFSNGEEAGLDWEKYKEKVRKECKKIAKNYCIEEFTDLNFYEEASNLKKSGFLTYDDALVYAGYRTDTENKTPTNKEAFKKATFADCITLECPYQATEMYKMDDLDAVIWYAINRGETGSTYNMNKMIWDNRLLKGKEVRNTNEQWENWLNSKDKSYHYIYAYNNISETGETGTDAYNFVQSSITITDEEGVEHEYPDAVYNYCKNGKIDDAQGKNLNVKFRKRKQTLYPIMQMFRDPNFPAEQRLCVSLSAQRYYNGAPANVDKKDTSTFLGIITPNHTLYKFNWEYMRSIKMFSAKSILAQFLDAILGGSIFAVDTDFNTQFIEQQLSTVLKKSIQADDTTVQDCFYTFSNDDYNEMMNNMELLRYKAKGVYGDDVKASVVDEESIMASINSINSSASSTGKTTTIQKTINQLTKTDGSDDMVTTDGEVTMTPGMQILYNILFALIKPFYASILSPKVILLFLINFHIAGVIDINEIKGWDDVWPILKSKLSAVLVSLVSIIKDKIYEIILEIILEYIKPLIEAMIAQITLEFMERWLRQLSEYTKCIPMFNFDKYNIRSTIDAVNYADIVEPENTTPETADKC